MFRHLSETVPCRAPLDKDLIIPGRRVPPVWTGRRRLEYYSINPPNPLPTTSPKITTPSGRCLRITRRRPGALPRGSLEESRPSRSTFRGLLLVAMSSLTQTPGLERRGLSLGVDISESLALLAVLEQAGCSQDEHAINTSHAEHGGEDVVDKNVGETAQRGSAAPHQGCGRRGRTRRVGNKGR